ncbi:hypothetical protein OY671_010626, partial [Metschnikowia pulcherrima]
PCRRTRTGHHDRRPLSLLRHRKAQVHRRRHARPRTVHAQHGDRRLHRRSRRDPDRRAQGRADADAAALVSRAPDRHPPHRAGGEQDGPCRLRPRRVRRHRQGLHRLRALDRHRNLRADPDLRLQGRQHHRAFGEHASVPGAGADGTPGNGGSRRHHRPDQAVPSAGAVGQPPQP